MVTNMDFAMSDKAQDYQKRLTDFMVTEVLPAEESYDAYRAAAGPGAAPGPGSRRVHIISRSEG